MSYFEFLIVFLLPPIGILAALNFYDRRRKKKTPSEYLAHRPWKVIFLLVLVAVIYTTPWDNYLVATSVWWYEPNQVTGTVIGWVPIEEYFFFVLQTTMTGLFTYTLARYLSLPVNRFSPSTPVRWLLSLTFLPLWFLSLLMLIAGWDEGTYLAILFVWAIPPIALQLAFGADILWYFRRLVLLAILVPTIYLAFADSLAIDAGTWTINPGKSLMIFIGGLPIEELIFFLTTNTLIVLGIILAGTIEGKVRLETILKSLRMKRNSIAEVASGQRGVAND